MLRNPYLPSIGIRYGVARPSPNRVLSGGLPVEGPTGPYQVQQRGGEKC